MIRSIYHRLKSIILWGQYIPTQYYIIKHKELIYIPIPKVACTSLKIAVMDDKFDQSDSTDQKSYMEVHSKATDIYESLSTRGYAHFYKFAFVRSPFDRLVSCYEDKVKKTVQHSGRYFFSSGYNNLLIKTLFGKTFHPDMTFHEFVELVSRIPDSLADAHFKSQYGFLHRNNRSVPDYIGHFENLAEDWKPVAEKYSFKELSFKNKSTRRHWSDYFESRETVELAAKRYARDIELFGYESDYQNLLQKTSSGENGKTTAA